MKVLIIPDSFKGSLTAIEVASEMEKAVRSIFPEASCTCMPFSDGGEGAIPVLEKAKELNPSDANTDNVLNACKESLK